MAIEGLTTIRITKAVKVEIEKQMRKLSAELDQDVDAGMAVEIIIQRYKEYTQHQLQAA